jgi:hypothetical protein
MIPQGLMEEELEKLQVVSHCHLQDWGPRDRRSGTINRIRGSRTPAGQGGLIRPADASRVSPPLRSGSSHSAPRPNASARSCFLQRNIGIYPGCRRSRDLRPKLVQPRQVSRASWAYAKRKGKPRELPWPMYPDLSSGTVDQGIHPHQALARVVGKDEQERRFQGEDRGPATPSGGELRPMDVNNLLARWYRLFPGPPTPCFKATSHKAAPLACASKR